MTKNDGALLDLSEMEKEDFVREMKTDNLTLVDVNKLTEKEKQVGVVSPERIGLVDRLKSKSRRVRRVALKEARKKIKKGEI